MGTRLNGKVALVTGAAQGIGRAIVEAFAAEAAQVIATDINPQKLRELPYNCAITRHQLDVTDEAAVHSAAESHRNVSILVNCAGVVDAGSILDSNSEDLQRSFRLNVSSVFSMTRAFLPAMLERKAGSIINIASVVSNIKAAPNRCIYATTKGAVVALTKSIALDFIKDGIRCNAISPGTVRTPSLDERMAAQPDRDAAMRQFVARQPMGRLGEAAEIASAAVFLASDEAAFITGSNVIIDGGFSL